MPQSTTPHHRTALAVILTAFVLAEVNYPFLGPQSQLAIFAGLGLLLVFLQRKRHPAIDLSAVVATLFCFGYVLTQGEPLFERFWQPMTRAVLNTDAEEASAALLWQTIKMTFLKGESACRPLIFPKGLSAALVTPDRQLATRGSAHLKRWGIEADDSAGLPLSRLPPGTLLIAMAEAVAERFAPVPL